ncbi:protein of unknown function [Xenorhabdus doucetiae]|uniref:Uncharacterized protein n=1 Tax=Xenorhabdus doucetiae TaxID=351671 RepID=A0A068QNX6_9GAMM|nr:RHS repeat protein [Xenorhabdus doucetiae]CDG16663.1 protein of unknown function [Xenorhabdus doucetiae]
MHPLELVLLPEAVGLVTVRDQHQTAVHDLHRDRAANLKAGSLTEVELPDGTTLHFGYDKLTRLSSVTASTGEVYRYERDAAGQIIRETDFTGRTLEYQYDKLGRRVLTQYPDGQQLRWHYSAAGLLVRQESWQPEENQRVLKDTTTYAYNKRHQLVKATNADAVVEYEYDNTTGLLTCERINGREITRKWDNLTGRPVSESVDGHTLHFGYNPMPTVRWNK